MQRPKKYFDKFFFRNYKFNQYKYKISDNRIIFIFSSYIELSFSKFSNQIYKNYIQRHNKFFKIPLIGTIKHIIIFFLFSLPVRLLSKKKNIIQLSQIDVSLILKSHIIKHKFTGVIVEKNTGYILDLLIKLLLKKSKQVSNIKLNFLKSRMEGQKYIIKNQNKIGNEIKFILKIIVFFLKLVRVKNFITKDTSSIKGSIITLAVKKVGGKVFEIFHGYHQANNLLGIFPPKPDIQFHWTQELVNSIKKNVPKSFSNKYKFLGYPVQIKNKTYSNILVLLPDLDDFNNRECQILINDIFEIINVLSKFTNVVVRPHPNSKNFFKKKFKKSIIQHKAIFSENLDAFCDLAQASLVIGHSSTILVTAIYNNIPSIMIKHKKSLYCDNVPIMSKVEIKRLIKSTKDIKNLQKNLKFSTTDKFNYNKFDKIIN